MTQIEHKLIYLLKKVMWQDYGDPDYHNPLNDRCVFCQGQRRNGHNASCEMMTILSEKK